MKSDENLALPYNIRTMSLAEHLRTYPSPPLPTLNPDLLSKLPIAGLGEG